MVNSSRHALEEHQMQQTYRFALTQLPKRQMLLHNVFVSVKLQTTVRPNEMSYMVSLDMSMSVRPHLKFGNVHLFELGGVGQAKVNAAAEKCLHDSLATAIEGDPGSDPGGDMLVFRSSGLNRERNFCPR
ncbi:hypothetical protein WJX77_006273 [Trebouxia sp. C0004]